jgi:hypothetical protein
MKRTAISLLIFAAAMVGASPSAQARQCSNATLKGAYGFQGFATILPAGTPRALIGRFTLDGAGRWSAALTMNDNGTIRRITDAGTYTVNPDCTGTLLPAAGSVEIVIVDKGREFYQLRTDPATVVLYYGVTKKQFRKNDE